MCSHFNLTRSWEHKSYEPTQSIPRAEVHRNDTMWCVYFVGFQEIVFEVVPHGLHHVLQNDLLKLKMSLFFNSNWHPRMGPILILDGWSLSKEMLKRKNVNSINAFKNNFVRIFRENCQGHNARKCTLEHI